MSSGKELFTEHLKKHGLSITRARLRVFEALLGQEPLTMKELLARVTATDRASVYRVIELFEQVGVVQRLYTGWKYKLELTDTFAEHHHHLTCIRCEKIIPLGGEMLETAVIQLSARHGFTPTAHQIEIQGLCRECHLVKPETRAGGTT